jgi:hypothetical protein
MNKNITQQLEAIKQIDLNLDLFYNIQFTKYNVTLQGTYLFETRIHCECLGFEFELTPHNWIKAKKDNVIITLIF